tara:strand:- start:2430 stop:2783 length:354 start_codon:yes stop_codon:yes gene_type:complete
MNELEVCQRPWGTYTNILDSELCKVKVIVVKPQCQPSYQYHHKRSEHWIVVQGEGIVTIDDTEKNIKVNDSVFVKIGQKHRIKNTSQEEDLIFIEVQTGTYFGEDDIVRVEDDFGRV